MPERDTPGVDHAPASVTGTKAPGFYVKDLGPQELIELFTVPRATINAHFESTLDVHGIPDTARLVTLDTVQDLVEQYAPAPDLTPYALLDGSRPFTGPVTVEESVQAVGAGNGLWATALADYSTSYAGIRSDGKLRQRGADGLGADLTPRPGGGLDLTGGPLSAPGGAMVGDDGDGYSIIKVGDPATGAYGTLNKDGYVYAQNDLTGTWAGLMPEGGLDINGRVVLGHALGLDLDGSRVVTAGNIGTYAPDPSPGLVTLTPGTTARNFITAGAATVTPLTVKGAASQSASLFEARDSASVVMAYITPAGVFAGGGVSVSGNVALTGAVLASSNVQGPYHTSTSNVGAYLQMNGSEVQAIQRLPAQVVFSVKGAAAQAARIFDVRSSADAVLMKVDPDGTLTSGAMVSSANVIANNGGAAQAKLGGGGANLWLGSADDTQLNRTGAGTLTMTAAGAATFAMLIVKGVASQSAELQRWTNSADAVMARVKSDGTISSEGGPGFWGNYLQDRNGAIGYLDMGTTGTTSIMAVNRVAGNRAFVVRGAPSQTNTLQEWQSSAGAVVASINSDGSAFAFGGLTSPTSITNIGNSGILSLAGSNTAANVFVQAAGAGHKAFVVKGAASQTANLTEWQNSTGTAVASMTVGGNLSMTDLTANQVAASNAIIGGGSYLSARLSTKSASVSEMAFVARGFASQTASLVEVQDSAAAIMFKVRSTGSLSFKTNVWHTGTDDAERIQFGSNFQTYYKGGANPPGTATAHEFRNQSNTVLMSIMEDGKLNLTNTVTALDFRSSGAAAVLLGQSSLNLYDGFQQAIGVLTTGSTYSFAVKHTKPLAFTTRSTTSTDVTRLTLATGDNPTMDFVNAAWRFTSPAAATVPTVIKGAASQTGNLTEWRNSADALLAYIDSAGGLNLGAAPVMRLRADGVMFPPTDGGGRWGGDANRLGSMYVNRVWMGQSSTMAAENTTVAVASSNVGWPVIMARGLASQTADLQQWQDSAGTSLAKIDSGGSLTMTRAYSALGSSGGFVIGPPGDANTAKLSRTAAVVTLEDPNAGGQAALTFALKAKASQTANLQDWQNSAGVSVATMGPTGRFDANSYVVAQSGTQAVYMGALGGAGSGIAFQNGEVNFYRSAAGAMTLTATGANSTRLNVKATASQSTTNLQEWQDSAGAALAYITPAGAINASGTSGFSSLTVGSTLTLAAAVWHGATDSTQRLHFATGASTYIKGAGVTPFIVRDGADTGIAQMASAATGGHISLLTSGAGIVLKSPDGLSTKTLRLANGGAAVELV